MSRETTPLQDETYLCANYSCEAGIAHFPSIQNDASKPAPYQWPTFELLFCL